MDNVGKGKPIHSICNVIKETQVQSGSFLKIVPTQIPNASPNALYSEGAR